MTTTINLGKTELIRKLYSYPNNFNEVGFLDQSLEETITTWLKKTIQRDGLNTEIRVSATQDDVLLMLSGNGEDLYGAALPLYLRAGEMAFQGSFALNAAHRWLYNWRFVLPHGLAMVNHHSVQLLHFPPDYVLERDQDYLTAHTTMRWAELLVENGASASATDKYQTIIDVAPVAAPSNAGPLLDGIYSVYTDYINELMRLWIPTEHGCRPMIAFGTPARAWLKSEYGINLPVLKLGSIQVNNGPTVNVLGANHPSFIYNAAKQQSLEPPQSTAQLLARTMRIMQQDLIAAGWQVAMAASPGMDPQNALADSTARWTDPATRQRICELTYAQAFNKSADEAQQLCALPPLVGFEEKLMPHELMSIDQEIDQLRTTLGALDGQEPDLPPPVPI